MSKQSAIEWKAYSAECIRALEDIAEILNFPYPQTPENVVEAVRSLAENANVPNGEVRRGT